MTIMLLKKEVHRSCALSFITDIISFKQFICHLSYEDRKNIKDELNENKSINQIAKEINKSHTSVLREIDRNKVYFVKH
jgi:hypothetical protein